MLLQAHPSSLHFSININDKTNFVYQKNFTYIVLAMRSSNNVSITSSYKKKTKAAHGNMLMRTKQVFINLRI